MGDVDVLASYLTNDLNGTIGAFYSIPWGQGRISSYTAWDGAEIKAPTSKRTLNGVSYYELSSGAELAYLAKTGGHWLNENYILTADIYLNETLPVWDQDGKCLNSDVLNLWHPIGDDEAPFTGVLLGNGFSVNGLYAAGSEHENQGLFGVISGGRIDGLSIRYAYVSNELDNTFSGAGILAGSISSSRTKQAEILNCCIDSCCVKGYRAGGYSATIGGIYGHLPVVKNCYSNCSVYGRKGNNIYVGGFFGDAACYAYNCLAAGLVDGYQMVGGFTGFQEVADTSFTNCISACRVTAEAVNGHLTAGGFIGDNPYRATLLNCFWVQDEHMNSDYQQSPLYGYAIKMDGTILSPGQFAYSHAQDILNEWVFQNPQTGSSIWLLRSGELILSKVRPVVTENGYVLSDYSRSGVPFALAAFDSLGKLVSFSTFHQGEVALPNGFHVSNLYRLFWMNYDFIPSRSAATF